MLRCALESRLCVNLRILEKITGTADQAVVLFSDLAFWCECQYDPLLASRDRSSISLFSIAVCKPSLLAHVAVCRILHVGRQ